MEYTHEIIMPNDDIPFKMFLFEGKDGNYVRQKHWHRSVEIFALFEGELEFYINEIRYPLQPGEFMLVNSNEIHSILSPKKNQTVVLQIPLATFEKYYTDERFIYFSHSSRLQDEEVMRLIREMYLAYQEKKCGYELKVQSQFYMLVYLLVTKYRKTEVNEDLIRHNKNLNKLSAITSYMKENYKKELSLESLAKTFGYSPTYLSRMFQKYAKTNYKTCLDNIRLEHAAKDLMNTEITIGEIAFNNGFANSKAFAKVFQAKYGMLPSEFRKCKMGT
ncbi:AraC family transcriptional regulator [Blautia obeum]|uniref:AraC family transcriptional regulator n=1 Tax=Blautia obeum TaxID=40520 RepID=UPI002A77D75D|nr:AraC family transcriptional regulator [Lachnospiraceae bacterium]MCI6533447.1 AraC family transcriptional regulator [Lachnospiraceae bacterium]MDY2612562.1 AraC family transcriptional regulator [Lachnospiraceae bacterium]